MGSIGAPELFFVLVVVLLFFGAPRLPKLFRSVGQASKEFKKGLADADDDETSEPVKTTEPAAIEAKDTKKPV